jgi:DNA-binding CsgD family transcriptional regulator
MNLLPEIRGSNTSNRQGGQKPLGCWLRKWDQWGRELTGGPRTPAASDRQNPALSKREREVLRLLADGMSGAQIAERLFLSPETVRTHVRNAMAKLGASTRSQAIAIALQHGELSEPPDPAAPEPQPAGPSRREGQSRIVAAQTSLAAGAADAALQALLVGITSLPDLDGGMVFVADEEGLSLRRGAHVAPPGVTRDGAPARVTLGDGPVGRVGLERSASIIRLPRPHGDGPPGAVETALAAPMLAGGRLVGVMCLVTRTSRPSRESEALLVQAFSNRVAELILSGGPSTSKRLGRALDHFRRSWAAVAGRD